MVKFRSGGLLQVATAELPCAQSLRGESQSQPEQHRRNDYVFSMAQSSTPQPWHVSHALERLTQARLPNGIIPLASIQMADSTSQQGVPWLQEALLNLPFMSNVKALREERQAEERRQLERIQQQQEEEQRQREVEEERQRMLNQPPQSRKGSKGSKSQKQQKGSKQQQSQQQGQQAEETPPVVKRVSVRPPPYLLDVADQQLWEAFAEMDVNGDDRIDWVELRAALEKLGLPCTPEYLVSMMNEYDLNRDNVIDWDEFRYYVHKREVEIERAFRHFDKNGDGVISVAELGQVLLDAGIPARDSDVRTMLDRIDHDHDKAISYDEFRRFAAFLPNAAQFNSNPALYAAWWQDPQTLHGTAGKPMYQRPGGRGVGQAITNEMRATGKSNHAAGGALMFSDMLNRAALVLAALLIGQGVIDGISNK